MSRTCFLCSSACGCTQLYSDLPLFSVSLPPRSARDFASKVFTILVETAGVEVKGAVSEVALEPGATVTWVFVPMRPGRYPLLCPVTGHVEAGMVGALVITPAAK